MMTAAKDPLRRELEASRRYLETGEGEIRSSEDGNAEDGDGAGPAGGGKKEKDSQGTEIAKLALAAGVELFHDPPGDPFATLPVDGRAETWPLRTKAVRRWLSRLYYRAEGKAASSEGTQSALGVLEGIALFDGAEPPSMSGLPSTRARSSSTSPTRSGGRWRSPRPAGRW